MLDCIVYCYSPYFSNSNLAVAGLKRLRKEQRNKKNQKRKWQSGLHSSCTKRGNSADEKWISRRGCIEQRALPEPRDLLAVVLELDPQRRAKCSTFSQLGLGEVLHEVVLLPQCVLLVHLSIRCPGDDSKLGLRLRHQDETTIIM